MGGFLEAEFNDLALALFALQFAHVEPYRRFCEARRATPGKVTFWTEIPPVPAAAFKEFQLSSLPAAERTTVFHSSGTTTPQPSRHFHNAVSLALYEASLLPWFKAHLLPDVEPFAIPFIILTPPANLAPNSSLAHMFETVRRELGAADSLFTGRIDGTGAWALDADATLKTLRKSTETEQPVALLGTAFSFVHLLDHLSARSLRFRLPAGSRVMETGGYKGRSRSLPGAELHALITRCLGIRPSQIVCEYGMSELSSQAYDCQVPAVESTAIELTQPCHASDDPLDLTPNRHRSLPRDFESKTKKLRGMPDSMTAAAGSGTGTAARLFRFPPWARACVISAETGGEVAEGETGLIQVWDLANVRSIMALQTEDLAVRRGDGFELVGRAALAEPRGCSLRNTGS